MKNLTGQKFGILEVIDRAPNKKKWTMWNCKCDCGKSVVCYSTHLIRGNTKSCGCQQITRTSDRIQWTGYGEISGSKWTEIKRGANNKDRINRNGIIFDITIEYAWDLFLKQNRKCALSGIELTFNYYRDKATASLDRIDSKGNYTEDNVQWVHKDINIMKNIYDQDYFINMCKKVAETHEI